MSDFFDTCKPLFGSVDANFGVTPYRGERIRGNMSLSLTSRRFGGIKIPVLRKVTRIGLFIDPLDTPSALVVKAPRVILAIRHAEGAYPIATRCKQFGYTAYRNSMDGQLLMLQFTNDLHIYDRYGVYLGIVEFQYPLFSSPSYLSLDFLVQNGIEAGGFTHIKIGFE